MCLQGVARLESPTQDWLMDPWWSHEQGTHGSSSSALTWTGDENTCWYLNSLLNKLSLDIKHRTVHLSRSVVSRDAGLTVDSRGVVPATNANTAPSALAVSVQTEGQVGHCLVKVTLLCFMVTVTL